MKTAESSEFDSWPSRNRDRLGRGYMYIVVRFSGVILNVGSVVRDVTDFESDDWDLLCDNA